MIMIIIEKGMFFHCFEMVVQAELDKANGFERSLACNVSFICVSQNT